MRLQIKEIRVALPAQIIGNDEIATREPNWDMTRVQQKTGVRSRHFARDGETAYDLALTACRELLAQNSGLTDKIDAVIFCTQSPDYIMPPNACLLHKELDLKDQVAAFDFNLACSGFPYGLAIADGFLKAKTARHILLVTADTYSKFISPQDRSVYSLFGDGAAVTWLTESSDERGLIDLSLATFGRDYPSFMIEAGGCRLPRSEKTAELKSDIAGNRRSQNHIAMKGQAVLDFVKSKVPAQVDELLLRNGLKLSDIDLVIPHQASATALDELRMHLKLPAERFFQNLGLVGNTVSASIPIALKEALEGGRIKTGHTVLLIGFGVGLSYASAILKY